MLFIILILKAIIIFDGICNLCNKAVFFVIKHDKKQYFQFAPLQSKAAEKLLKPWDINPKKSDSIILIHNNRLYTESSAALKIAGKLNGIWKLGILFFIVPKFIRDAVYRLIARNRYRWFGKKDVCMTPTKELEKRFL